MNKKWDYSPGIRFNQFVIIEKTQEKNKYNKPYYLVKCDCGNTRKIIGSDLQTNRYKSCGCRRNQNSPRRLNPGQSLLNELFKKFLGHGKRRGIPTEIDRKYWEIIVKTDCYYCGSKPLNEKKLITKSCKESWVNESVQFLNGIDRFYNEYGYSIENCVPCCWTCNNMKGKMDGDEFLNKIQTILNFTRDVTPLKEDVLTTQKRMQTRQQLKQVGVIYDATN